MERVFRLHLCSGQVSLSRKTLMKINKIFFVFKFSFIMRFAFEIRRQTRHTIFCSLTLTVYATHKLLSRQTFQEIKSHFACHVQNVPGRAACIGSFSRRHDICCFPSALSHFRFFGHDPEPVSLLRLINPLCIRRGVREKSARETSE